MTPDLRTHSSAVERLADDMVARWRRGERPRAEDYLARAPELRHQPEAALELIAEELALREEYGPPVVLDELVARFPRWEAQVRALVQFHRALGPHAAPPFPAPGESLGEFRLASELGRGAHGRVYLATQPALGGRPVVVKLGPAAGDEHLSLARLQHTHIVPLYSAHEFPDRGLRGLCLPYFGGATLADALARMTETPGPRTGRDLLPTAKGEADLPRGPAWDLLARATYPDAVCWVGACLADALQYAHDRGLLHLDLKPSNVLVAADGVPMLLDFHLARPPLAAAAPAPAWLGGTPGYMPAEQLAALQAVREGTPVPAAVDARADVFALGVLLGELLRAAGAPPVPTGLADVLARATAAAAGDRYPTAAAFAADLRRHLSDLPLKGVGNRSLAERWRKWRRRRPAALPLALALAALAAVGGGLALHAGRLADRARAAHRDGLAHTAQGHYIEAADALRNGEALIAGLPFQGPLRAQLRDARAAAERGRAAGELHDFADRVRPLYAAESVTPEQARAAAARCREVWDRRDAIAAELAAGPGAAWRTDLLDVAVLLAALGERAAPPGRTADAHRAALATLAEAESLLGPAAVLDLERARHARALGLTADADAALRRADATPPRGAWDHLALGRAHLAAGDLPRAAAAFDRALEREPASFWASYYQGACRLRANEPAGALAAFAACVALAPHSAWCAYNRGLAYADLGQPDRAAADFERAVALDPGFGAAFLARAAVHHRAGRFPEALADLQRAAAAGVPPAAVAYQRAVVLLAANDRPAALASLRACVAADPAHAPARALLERLTTGP